MSEANDQNEVVLANLPAGPAERRIALALGLVLLAIGVAVVPFGRVRTSATNAWSPIITTFIFVTDLITSFLLISQFRIVRSRGLLVLASGYLFTGAMNISVLLTMWEEFSPTGLLGAGLQTAAWLWLASNAGYPLGVLFYVLLKDETPGPAQHRSSHTAIAASVAIVIAVVLALTWIGTAGESHLPKIVPLDSQSSANLRHVGTLLLLVDAAVLALLWSRRRSVLDLWLSVAMCAWLAQGIAAWINSAGRFGLSYYAAGWLFATSSTVLLLCY